MPRYHFRVHDRIHFSDLEGTEFENDHAARREALTIAGALFGDAARRSELGEDWRIEVRAETGQLLFRLDFTVANPPAATPLSQPSS